MNMQQTFDSYGLTVTPEQTAMMQTLLDSFVAYNSHTNLSAIREPSAIIIKHFIDSLELITFVNLQGSLLDIGTGGGFPALPLKIVRPGLSVVAMDSVGKKTKAIDTFVAELKLSGITTEHARAEDPQIVAKYTRSFDSVVSRATAYLPIILTWSEPYVKSGGYVYVYKTPSTEEAQDGIKVLKRLSLTLTDTYTYTLDGQERSILAYKKS
jgi:16S rRNA (guanine527-N7)-methyltransferase